MTTTTDKDITSATQPGVGRAIPFRIVAVLIALVQIVVFGAWQSVLAPWVTFADVADHGWTRSVGLHRLADSASGILMLAIGAAFLLAAKSPFGRSTVIAWATGSLAFVSIGSAASMLIQQQASAGAAALTAATMLTVFTVLPLLAHPDRRTIATDGALGLGRPSTIVAAVFASIGLTGIAIAAWAIAWRLGGGIIENSLEDDVVSFVVLGASVAFASALCFARREGWRTLAVVLAGVIAYGTVAVISIV